MAAFRHSLTAIMAGCGFIVAGPVASLAEPRHATATDGIRSSVFDWQGAYGGPLFSVESFRAGSVGPSSSLRITDGNGRLAGIVAGYNFVRGGWVYGIEADAGYGQLRAARAGYQLKADVMGTLRARWGRGVDYNLFYATAGISFTGVNQRSALMINGKTTTHLGLVMGGGLERAFTPAITGRLEYLYGHTLETKHMGIEHLHMIRAGAVYHFSG